MSFSVSPSRGRSAGLPLGYFPKIFMKEEEFVFNIFRIAGASPTLP